MAQDDRELASVVPAFDVATWQALAQRVLEAAPLERLTTRTPDGIAVRPLYTRADALVEAAPAWCRAGAAGGWEIRQLHAYPDPALANQAILTDLERGATGIALRLDTSLRSNAQAPDGILAFTLGDLDRLLAGVQLDLAPVSFEGGGVEAAVLFLALLERRGHRPGQVTAAFNLDPVGAALRPRGAEPEAELRHGVELAGLPMAAGGLSTFLADGRPWHAAGASEAEELAATLATALLYLRRLEAAGLDLAAAARAVAFAFAVDADVFPGIAKLRAARRLWSGILEACGEPEAAPMRLHAETATRMLSRRDPFVNILRGTVAAFAGIAGGADSLTVLPFDHALGLPDAFSRRLARNTHLVLMEESHLARVADPAGGGWYVESLTAALAERAWALFQEIEAQGGILEALGAGWLQERVAGSWATRAARVATRKDQLVGVSEFADLDERPRRPEPFDAAPLAASARERLAAAVRVSSLEEARVAAGAGKAFAFARSATAFRPLPAHRLGEGFEDLRARSDLALVRDGARPGVFLACLGPLAAHGVRAGFARNLFEAGGLLAVASPPLTGVDAVVMAFRDAGTAVAVLCASDEVYAELAGPAAEALKAAGAATVCLMGNPGEQREAFAAKGVDLFVHQGCDMLAILQGLHDRLGTPAA